MEREKQSLILGLALLVSGIVILMFVLVTAVGLAANPGPFMDRQIAAASSGTPPTAMFTWSSNGFDVQFHDASAGSSPIATYDWDFGDGTQSPEQNPSHTYAGNDSYTVILRVTDEGGRQGVAGTGVNVQWGMNNNGSAEPNQNFDVGLGEILLPVAIALLVFGLYVVGFLCGGSLVKAGWNLIRPRPETIRIRLKPQQLEQYATAEVAQPARVAAPPPMETLPPPPNF